jgi:hypothetical protein
MIIASLMLLMALSLNNSLNASPVDSDSDGLADELEQELLTKFAPKFMLSSKECDGLPAEFRQGLPKPESLAKNGTIYGQVFPIALPEKPGDYIEIHYYHLWNRDCGLNGHELDVERASVLIWAASRADPSTSWKAKYWFAAAHEDTICDASYAARSRFIDAEQQGPVLYISAGKHASFLDQELCRGGCGGDSCSEMKPMTIDKIINLGERHAPMNGASWIEWQGWTLAAKMNTDFPESVLAKIEAHESAAIVSVNESLAPVKAAILAGSSTAKAFAIADQKNDAAISSASRAIGASAAESTEHAGGALKRAARAVWKALTRAIRIGK